MGRLLIGGLIVAIIAALLFFFYSSSYQTRPTEQTQQISQLNDQMLEASKRKRAAQGRALESPGRANILAAQNEEMRKAIAKFKATGKMPVIPPPPK